MKSNVCVLDVAGRMTCTVKTPRPLPSPCVARPVASRADTCGSRCCFRQAALVPSEGETPPRSAAAPAVRCSHCCRGQRLARGGLSGKDAEGAASWGHGRVRAESSPGGTDADDGACSTRTHRCRVVSACSVPTSPRAPHTPRGSAGRAGRPSSSPVPPRAGRGHRPSELHSAWGPRSWLAVSLLARTARKRPAASSQDAQHVCTWLRASVSTFLSRVEREASEIPLQRNRARRLSSSLSQTGWIPRLEHPQPQPAAGREEEVGGSHFPRIGRRSRGCPWGYGGARESGSV